MRGRTHWSRSRGHLPQGFTLVEVLIALFILLVGVYAIMAIFPRGYAAMEASQMRITASQLAEAELARWKMMPESIPDQIIATDYNGRVIEGTIAGTRTSGGTPGTAASMLLVWDQNVIPNPMGTQYHLANLDDNTFLRLSSIPGALYNPENLTSCQYDPVSNNPIDGGATFHPVWQPNSVYLPRTVIGEQIDIMRLGSQATGVPFYLLSHAPLDVLRKTPDQDDPNTVGVNESTQPPTLMDIYDSRLWQYKAPPVSNNQVEIDLTEREFTYLPLEQRMYFGPMTDGVPQYTTARSFKVDYTAITYTQANVPYPTRIYGLTLTTDTQGSATLGLIPASVQSFRVFERLRLLTQAEYDRFNNTPYENIRQQTWTRTSYYIDPNATRLTGKIEFCPYLLTDPQPDDITLVKVDYRVEDWSILVFDVEVPPGGMVQLPINHLKGSGYTNPPRQQTVQPVAKGVRQGFLANGDPDPNFTGASTWAYVIAVDRQNGDILTDIDQKEFLMPGSVPANAKTRRTRFQVDFKNGILYFNYDPAKVAAGTYNANIDTPDRSGRTYRIYCRGEADWAVQLMPSARVYARSSDNPLSPPMGSETGSALLSYTWDKTKNDRQIFFPLSESGQTVVVDYFRSGTGEYVEGEVHTIGGPQVTDLGVWVCGLSEPLTYSPTYLGPITVRGLSLRARTVWVGKGRRPTLGDVAKAIDINPTQAPTSSLEESWYQVIVTTIIPRTPI